MPADFPGSIGSMPGSGTAVSLAPTLPERRTGVALIVNQHVANNGQFPYASRNDTLKSVGGKDLLDDELVAVFHEPQAFGEPARAGRAQAHQHARHSDLRSFRLHIEPAPPNAFAQCESRHELKKLNFSLYQ